MAIGAILVLWRDPPNVVGRGGLPGGVIVEVGQQVVAEVLKTVSGNRIVAQRHDMMRVAGSRVPADLEGERFLARAPEIDAVLFTGMTAKAVLVGLAVANLAGDLVVIRAVRRH